MSLGAWWTLSLVNAAELRELTATVFKTYLVPCSESVAEAMVQSRASPKQSAQDAQEQLGPRYVHVWVAFLRSLAATRGLAPEHVAVLKSYWESNVVKSAPVQLAAPRTALSSEAVQESIFLPRPRSPSPSRERWKQHCSCRKG